MNTRKFCFFTVLLFCWNAQADLTLDCSKNAHGLHFGANIHIAEHGISSAFLSASVNKLTRMGHQSQHLVGRQQFKTTLVSDQGGFYELHDSIPRHQDPIAFRMIQASENENGSYTVKLHGPALKPWGRLKFSTCEKH